MAGHCLSGGPFHRLTDMDHLRRVHETHDRSSLSSAAIADYVPHPGGYLVRIGMFMARSHHVREQIGAFLVSLFVIKSLVVGQRRRRIEHMDGAGHIGMSQANQLEIADGRKNYGISLAIQACEYAAIDARTVVKGGEIGRSAIRRPTTGASDEARRAYLP